MFPCSSIYQNYPRTNQTLIKIDDQIGQYYDPFQSYDDDHYYHSLVLPYNNDQPLIINPPIIEEDESVTLSHLGGCSPQQVSYINHHGRHYDQKQRRSSSSSVKRSNKDRHSKIYTAHGLRDRRMRLSLQIARKFFDLQDLLGFDKASRTIDWLFAKSQTAIDELKGCNSTSGGEAREIEIPRLGPSTGDDDYKDVRRKVVVLRESRDKARARARARTREKILEKSRQSNGKTFHGCCDPNNPFKVDFPQNWEMITTVSRSIYNKAPTSDLPLNPNVQPKP